MFLELVAPGTVRVTFDEDEAEFLRQIPHYLQAIYHGTDPDPARDRLFPKAYLDPTEEEAEDQWNAMVVPELLRERLDGLEALVRTLDDGNVVRTTSDREQTEVTLGPEELNLWLGVLNDARLAFGTRITEDSDVASVRPGDPLAAERMVYRWLTELQGYLVDVMLDTLPDT